jgi:hypothetical protein
MWGEAAERPYMHAGCIALLVGLSSSFSPYLRLVLASVRHITNRLASLDLGEASYRLATLSPWTFQKLPNWYSNIFIFMCPPKVKTKVSYPLKFRSALH